MRLNQLTFSLFVSAGILHVWGPATRLSAQDFTVPGNLFVANDADISGNTLSFGSSLSSNPASPGLLLTYGDGTTPTLAFSASRDQAIWLWQANGKLQARLTAANSLQLFTLGATTPSISLNPDATSTFAQGLTVGGVLTAVGGLSSSGITGGTTGMTLNAGGTNQNITLAPSGTGVTTTASPVRVTNSTQSTSTTTGALTVTGGMGVGGTFYATTAVVNGTITGNTLRLNDTLNSLSNLGLGTGNLATFAAVNTVGNIDQNYIAPVARLVHNSAGPIMDAPQSVAVAGNFAYVGSSSSTSFQIIDINNPLAPLRRGVLIGNGSAGAPPLSTPRGIALSGQFAYVTSTNNHTVSVINVANPDAPALVATLTNGSAGLSLNGAYGITIAGSHAYVASSGSHALQIINIANPAAPVPAGRLVDATNLTGARAVAVAGNHAYVVGNTANSFAVIDVSNPASPILRSVVRHGAAGLHLQGPTGVAVAGNFAYVSSATSNAVQVFDVSNPAAPVAVAALLDGVNGAQLKAPSSIRIDGTLAYVTSTGSPRALQVIDISTPSQPRPSGQLLDGAAGVALNNPTSVAISGPYAYVTSAGNRMLHILQIGGSGAGYQVKGSTVLTTNAANDVLLGSGLPSADVAIGTSSATARLTVAGADTSAGSAAVNFTDATGKSLLQVQNDGKVGIGTETPTAKLDVEGDVNVSGTLTVGGQPVVTASQLSIYATTAQVASQLAPIAKPTTLYNTAGTPAVSISSNGYANFSNGLIAGPGASANEQFNSTAIGEYANAGGPYSTAIGQETTANGYASTAIGHMIEAIGQNSTAIGKSSVATGRDALVLGTYSQAIENFSTAIGVSAQANGEKSTAIGASAQAMADHSTAIGTYNAAVGAYSTAIGSFSTASGISSLAAGSGATANGASSSAFGYGTQANGNYSTTMGEASVANGDWSFASGYNSFAWGATSTAIGYEAAAYGMHSTAIGYKVTAYGTGSMAIGIRNAPRNVHQANTSFVDSENELFVVGNGSDTGNGEVFSNAFSVKFNGNTYIQGNLGIGTEAPTAKLDVEGDAKITGTLTVTKRIAKLRVEAQGDIGMGLFTAGSEIP